MTDLVLPGLTTGSVGLVCVDESGDPGQIALQAAYAVASGTNVGELWPHAPQTGPAVFVSAIDGVTASSARIENLSDHVFGTRLAVPELLHVIVDPQHELTLFERDRDRIRATAMLHNLAAHMTARRPRLIVFDMFVRYLNRAGLRWNDLAECEAVLTLMRRLAEDLDTAILLVPSPWATATPRIENPLYRLTGADPTRLTYVLDGRPESVPLERTATGCLVRRRVCA